VFDAVKEVMVDTGCTAAIELHPEMPTGPKNRMADNSLARRLLGWEPKVPFVEGLHRTIDWYFSTKDPEEIIRRLDRALTER
jgi:nucleoside-diphosphate-sugar epimerase